MFYNQSLVYNQSHKDEQRERDYEASVREQNAWIQERLNRPNLRLDCDLQDGEHLKFKAVCALRLLQIINRKS